MQVYRLNAPDNRACSALSQDDRANLIATLAYTSSLFCGISYSLGDTNSVHYSRETGTHKPDRDQLDRANKQLSKRLLKLVPIEAHDFRSHIDIASNFLKTVKTMNTSDFIALQKTFKEAENILRAQQRANERQVGKNDLQTAEGEKAVKTLADSLNSTNPVAFDETLGKKIVDCLSHLGHSQLLEIQDFTLGKTYKNPSLVQMLMQAGLQSDKLSLLKSYCSAIILTDKYGIGIEARSGIVERIFQERTDRAIV